MLCSVVEKRIWGNWMTLKSNRFFPNWQIRLYFAFYAVLKCARYKFVLAHFILDSSACFIRVKKILYITINFEYLILRSVAPFSYPVESVSVTTATVLLNHHAAYRYKTAGLLIGSTCIYVLVLNSPFPFFFCKGFEFAPLICAFLLLHIFCSPLLVWCTHAQ